jgi:hypothetical protein
MSPISQLARAFAFLTFAATSAVAAPTIVQSEIVDFPVNGRVTVQAREEIGKFPRMVFISAKTNKPLLVSSIQDRDKWLIPNAEDSVEFRPSLRFRVIHSAGFTTPLIMSVGLFTGGSDNAYFLTVFAEVSGRIVRLNNQPLFANVQGGYYLGQLNKSLGYGLATWNFVWATGAHYSEHKYAIEIYRINRGKLIRILRTTSKRAYDSDKGADSLLELGIKAVDQRNGIPRIKDTLN